MNADFPAPDSPNSGSLSLHDPAHVTWPVQMSEPQISQPMVADSSATDSLHTGELSLSDLDGLTPLVQMPEPRNLQSGILNTYCKSLRTQ